MYQLYVSMVSPYSLKAAAMVGYTGLPCEIVRQNALNRYRVIKALTGKTMVPVLREGSWAMNDSTSIAKFLITRSPRPTLPRSARYEPLCWLLEEFADEWMTRWVIYSRWFHLQDTQETSAIIGRELARDLPLIGPLLGRQATTMVRRRLASGGITSENDGALQNSQHRCLEALESLFDSGPLYLFEGYPTVADFAFYGALGQFASDYTGRGIMRKLPALRAYVERLGGMVPPMALIEVSREPSRDIAHLQPLFAEFLGTYWPVLVANFRAMAQGRVPKVAQASLVDGATFSFTPSGYMVARFKQLLALLDETYSHQDHLFGEEGMRFESALMSQIAGLTHHLEGRQLLREYHHLGMH